MKKFSQLLLIVFSIIFFASYQAEAFLCSTFDTGDEGWSTWANLDVTAVTPISWIDIGGNPEGFVYAEDIITPVPNSGWVFMAPAAWGGDWTPYIGGLIEWDLKVMSAWETPPFSRTRQLIIVDSNSNVLFLDSPTTIQQLNEWNHIEFELLAENFSIQGTASFEEIMSDIDFVLITGEWSNGPDSAGLDNVRVSPAAEPATVDIHPDTMNKKSKGKYITSYIELPETYSVEDIDIQTIMLSVNGYSIPAELSPTEIGDYNDNGIPDFMVKFDRQSAQDACEAGAVEMILTCQTYDETNFEGSDTVLAIEKGQGHYSEDHGSVIY